MSALWFQLTVLKPSCRSVGSSSARACLAFFRTGSMTSFHRDVWRRTISWMLLNSFAGSTSVSRPLSCRFSSPLRNSCTGTRNKTLLRRWRKGYQPSDPAYSSPRGHKHISGRFMYRSWFLLCNSQTHYLYVSADDRSSLCTYMSDDSQFLYVGGLCVQQLPYRLLLVELSPCQCLHTNIYSQIFIITAHRN